MVVRNNKVKVTESERQATDKLNRDAKHAREAQADYDRYLAQQEAVNWVPVTEAKEGDRVFWKTYGCMATVIKVCNNNIVWVTDWAGNHIVDESELLCKPKYEESKISFKDYSTKGWQVFKIGGGKNDKGDHWIRFSVIAPKESVGTWIKVYTLRDGVKLLTPTQAKVKAITQYLNGELG